MIIHCFGQIYKIVNNLESRRDGATRITATCRRFRLTGITNTKSGLAIAARLKLDVRSIIALIGGDH